MTWQMSSSRSSRLTWQQGAICVLLLGVIGIGSWRLIKHRQQEQNYQESLQQIEALKMAQDYKACRDQAKQIPASSQFYPQAQQRLQECTAIQAAFDQANKFAEAGDFNLAIAAVLEIADPTALTKVTQSVKLWSEQTLQKAQQTYEDRNGRIQEALEIARWITSNNPAYPQAQTKIQAWIDQWSRNEACWKTAQSALYARQFEIALAQIQQLDHPYWQQQALPIAGAISVYTSVLAVLPAPTQPSPQPVQSDSNAGYTNAQYMEVIDPNRPGSADSGNAAENSGADFAPYGNWLGEPEADVASLTLKFLIPLSVPLMLGLGRSRN